MEKRGPKPKGKVKLEWSPNFAYSIGLLATDGSLSKDGRHIDFTSKEIEQLKNFNRALGITIFIGTKKSGVGKISSRVQFSDVSFYQFLLDIGMTPAKSKILGALKIPPEYFFDFLRGSFDGDGSFYVYEDKRWKSSSVCYTVFCSASQVHIEWVRNRLHQELSICGHITKGKERSTYQLRYGKQESLKIIKNMYYSDSVICLSRKREKAEKIFRLPIRTNAQVVKLADTLP